MGVGSSQFVRKALGGDLHSLVITVLTTEPTAHLISGVLFWQMQLAHVARQDDQRH